MLNKQTSRVTPDILEAFMTFVFISMFYSKKATLSSMLAKSPPTLAARCTTKVGFSDSKNLVDSFRSVKSTLDLSANTN